MASPRTIAACAAALLTLSACDNPAGRDGSRVELRFGLAGARTASEARLQTGGSDQLVITGTNGTLTIADLRMIVAEFELEGDDEVNTCGIRANVVPGPSFDDDDDGDDDDDDSGDDDVNEDDCEDFDAGPLFVDFPLGSASASIATGNVPAGTYTEVEFEVEDLDDDEENAAERARIDQLRAQILAQFPDWPRDASLLVVGTFTPTGGQPVPFRAFVEAEIEIEIELSPPLTVAQGESRGVDVLLDPAALFRNGAGVVDLSRASGELELELKIKNGFRGRSDDD